MEELSISVTLIGLFLSVAWVFRSFLSHRRSQSFLRLQSELHHKVIDRFGTADEALAYLNSGAGEKLLASTPAPEKGSVYRKVLASLQAGIVLVALGFAFLVLKENIRDRDADTAFLFFGVLSTFLGLGFLAASGVGYRLSKKWGLLEDTKTESRLSIPIAATSTEE